MSKRISEGERRLTMLVAQQQADIDIAVVRIEQLQDMVAGMALALTNVLARPPFTREPKS
jgi:hypothetical protein